MGVNFFNGNPSRRYKAIAASRFFFRGTIVTWSPKLVLDFSWSISGKTSCSLKPILRLPLSSILLNSNPRKSFTRGRGQIHEPLEEIFHVLLAEGNLEADNLIFPDFEARDRFLGGADRSFLTRDSGKFLFHFRQDFLLELPLLASTGPSRRSPRFFSISCLKSFSVTWNRLFSFIIIFTTLVFFIFLV